MKIATLILSAGLVLTLSGCSENATQQQNKIPSLPQATHAAATPAPHGCLRPPRATRCVY